MTPNLSRMSGIRVIPNNATATSESCTGIRHRLMSRCERCLAWRGSAGSDNTAPLRGRTPQSALGLGGSAKAGPLAAEWPRQLAELVLRRSGSTAGAMLIQKSENVIGPEAGSKVAKAVAVPRGVAVGGINLQFVRLGHLVHLC